MKMTHKTSSIAALSFTAWLAVATVRRSNAFATTPHPKQRNTFPTAVLRYATLSDNDVKSGTTATTTTTLPSGDTTLSTTTTPQTPPLAIDDDALITYQKKSQTIASSFRSRAYETLPLFTNPHFQTLSGAFLRSIPLCKYWNARSLFPNARRDEWTGWDERERFDTPDGDFFHVDWKYAARGSNGEGGAAKESCSGGGGTVVMTHGFEASSNSGLSTDMATSFMKRGYDVACINFRGCSGEPNLTLKSYHLGFTDDLKQLLSVLRDRGTTREGPIYLSGFSLGANVVLKLLGELGEAATDEYNIRGSAVIAPPLDVSKHYLCLERPGISKSLYTPNFLKSVIPKARHIHDRLGAENVPFDMDRVEACTTVAEIETHLVSPIFGFRDNLDYYEQVSCGQFLKGIGVPTLIINARDDPFFDPSVRPEEVVPYNPVRYVCEDHGGHLGYMFHTGEGGGEEEVGCVSWASNELGRFLEHVDNSGASS